MKQKRYVMVGQSHDIWLSWSFVEVFEFSFRLHTCLSRWSKTRRGTIAPSHGSHNHSSLSQNVNALGYRIDMSTGILMWYVKGMCTNVLILAKGVSALRHLWSQMSVWVDGMGGKECVRCYVTTTVYLERVAKPTRFPARSKASRRNVWVNQELE